MGALLDEVVGPDVVAVLGPESDARAIGQPQTAALRLLGGHLQPLASPDPLDPLVVDQPAGPAQQRCDLAVAVTAILPGQLDDVGCQPLLIITAPRDLALRRAMLAERRTGAALGDGQLASNCSMQARRRAGLRSFPWRPPQDQLSSVRSDTARRSRRSPAPGASAASPDPTSGRRTPGASGNTSPPSRRSADRFGQALALRGENINLPQLRDNLFRLVSLPCHLIRPPCSKAILRGGPLRWGRITTQGSSVDRRVAYPTGLHTPANPGKLVGDAAGAAICRKVARRVGFARECEQGGVGVWDRLWGVLGGPARGIPPVPRQ